jgi:MMP 1-O-methyltransferase
MTAGAARPTFMDTDQPPYPFERVWAFAERIRGWLRREEAELLHRLAGEAGSRGRIVELGSYCGRSSIVLAAGLAGASSDPLVCVDTFRGSPEQQPGSRYFDAATLVDGVVNTYPEFLRNVQSAGLSECIEAMRLSTLAAAATLQAPIALLFVDADHSYGAVHNDLEAWAPKVVQNGWIVLHDVGDWSGPTRAAADLLDAGFRRYAQSESALALRKTPTGDGERRQ